MNQSIANMKIFFFLLALIVIGAATAQAQLEDKQCQDDGQAMDACRDYLKQQCTASAMPITWPWKWRMSSCRRLRLRCCNQLEQMPPGCRCRAIRSTVQEVQAGLPAGSSHQTMSKVMEMAKNLLSICNIMYPAYCN